MGGESPVKLPLGEDSSLSRCTGGVYHKKPILLGQTGNSCRGEVEVTSFERMQDHCVGDIASTGNLVPLNVECTRDDAKAFWREGTIR